MMLKRAFIQVVSSTDGRDRWLVGWNNTIRWAWSAPRFMSVQSWLWRRSPDRHNKRGG
jgi:hypothetical protein